MRVFYHTGSYMYKVVVIGGGHGQSTILKGIKNIEDIEISAIVTVADDGGSTGRIRSLYNIPAMGDIRNVLLALTPQNNYMTDLLNYRFSPGNSQGEYDIIGHNLGNLILTALTDTSGSFSGAIETMKKVLNVKEDIIPSTLDIITLYARMDDDTIVMGEANIPSFNHHIKEVFYMKKPQATKEAISAITEADLVIYGIGSVYTSIIPNIIIDGINKALKNTKALRVYFANCMTQNNETFDYDLKDHIKAMEDHGAIIDLVVKHKEAIPEYIKERYLKENSIEVIDHHDTQKEVMTRDLLDFSLDLVRHDPEKIKIVTEEILKRL